MSVDKSILEHVAKLAMRDVETSTTDNLVADMSRIIDLVEQLKTVDTESAEPLFHPLSLTQSLREDEVSEDSRDRPFLHLAEKTQDGHYLVPKVID